MGKLKTAEEMVKDGLVMVDFDEGECCFLFVYECGKVEKRHLYRRGE